MWLSRSAGTVDLWFVTCGNTLDRVTVFDPEGADYDAFVRAVEQGDATDGISGVVATGALGGGATTKLEPAALEPTSGVDRLARALSGEGGPIYVAVTWTSERGRGSAIDRVEPDQLDAIPDYPMGAESAVEGSADVRFDLTSDKDLEAICAPK